MFAVIYKGHIYPEAEEKYKKRWNQIATYFIEHRGAIGSCLHKATDGQWVAYSRWPDKETRDASWPKEGEEPSKTLTPEIQAIISDLKNCIDKDQPFEEICMEIIDDLLFTKEISHA
jgi:hypothetical protein